MAGMRCMLAVSCSTQGSSCMLSVPRLRLGPGVRCMLAVSYVLPGQGVAFVKGGRFCAGGAPPELSPACIKPLLHYPTSRAGRLASHKGACCAAGREVAGCSVQLRVGSVAQDINTFGGLDHQLQMYRWLSLLVKACCLGAVASRAKQQRQYEVCCTQYAV